MKKGVFFFPNLLTTGNLFCGIMSIIFTVMDALKLQAYEGETPPFGLSAWLIILAGLFDYLDGMVARLMKASSRFGVEYDSLADLVSFGVAPALLLYVSILRYRGTWGVLITAWFIIAGALRLARYNSQVMTEERKNFMGMPIPAGAGLLVSYILFSRWYGLWYGKKDIIFNSMLGWYEENILFFNTIFVPVFVFVVSCLMVSTLEFPGMKGSPKKRMPFLMMALFVFVLALAVHSPEIVLFVLLTVYMFWALWLNLSKFWRPAFKEKKAPHLEKHTFN